MARKDSLTATIDSGARPWGLEGNVVAGVGRLSVHPPTCPPPLEHANTVILYFVYGIRFVIVTLKSDAFPLSWKMRGSGSRIS